jgi:hypothetical protein
MLDKLLELGRDRGFITCDEILASVPEPERNVEDIDQLYATLGAEGIAVIDSTARVAPTLIPSGSGFQLEESPHHAPEES